MHICIYETDRPEDVLQPRFGTYASMFETWLGQVLPEARFSRAWLMEGAPPPPVGTADAVLITGSRAGVPDGLPWVDALMAHLRDLRAAGTPMAGVCFGHQVMAGAFGGRVERAGCGWIIGRHLHRPTAAGAALFGADPLALVSAHRDQVVVPPPGAAVLLASDGSPHGAFGYDFPALSVQVHPEFGGDYIEAVLETGLDLRFEDDLVAAARAGLHDPLDAGVIARGFARFLRETARAS